MIDAKDLRKGNKVIHEGRFLTVAQIREFEVLFIESAASIEYEDLEPIVLSPGILEDCGFEGGIWAKKSLGLWPVGSEGYNNLVLGQTASSDGLPYCPAIEQYSGHGFTIKEAAEIQAREGETDDDAFPLKHKSMVVLPKLKYLHQLQNLYFALTGTELQIDEKIFHRVEEKSL